MGGLADMKALIEKILIAERVRKEITKIDELAADIKANGLLHPITVMSLDGGEFRLLAGLRRLRALEILGETEIEVKAVSPANAEAELQIKISENEQREPFTFSETVDYGRLLDEIEAAKALERKAIGGKGGFEDVPDGAHLQKGRTRDIVSKKIGMGRTNYECAKYIAKKATPEIIDELDKGKRSIRGTYDELKKAENAAEPSEPEIIEEVEESDVDFQYDDGDEVTSQFDEPPKTKTSPAGLLSKADEEAIERNKAFNALSPQKKVVELQRQLKEERARAARAESELERLKELRHNDVFHKDGIINNLKERLAEAEARIKELEDLYCPS